MKRFVCLILALVLVLGMVPVIKAEAASDELYGMRKLAAGESYTDMTTSQEMVDVIKDFEGFRATAYADNTQWSIGYGSYCGSINDPKPGYVLTEDEAEQWLRRGLKKTYEPVVNNYCESIGRQPNQQQFDALVDLTYNVGYIWTTGTSVTSVLENEVDALTLVKGIGAYSRANDRVSYVHVNRRIREALVYLYGEYYRAYGGQDCKSDVPVVSNHDLPHFKTVIFKTNYGALENGRSDFAEYYYADEYYGKFNNATRSGYTLVGWEITKRSDERVYDGERCSIYDIVEENLELTAVWEYGTFDVPPEEPPEDFNKPEVPELEGMPEVEIDMDHLPFEDVAADSWYRDAVNYVYRNELMNGTSATSFNPDGSMTRGMLVTVLYRLDGSVPVSDEERGCFEDVGDAYYADAVAWAYANGIVKGVTETTFAPDRVVTRQEAVTIFHRYCVDYSLLNAKSGISLEGFADVADVADYAEDALTWAVATGLIGGTSQDGQVYLNPTASLSRAQAATLLMRCVEDIL